MKFLVIFLIVGIAMASLPSFTLAFSQPRLPGCPKSAGYGICSTPTYSCRTSLECPIGQLCCTVGCNRECTWAV